MNANTVKNHCEGSTRVCDTCAGGAGIAYEQRARPQPLEADIGGTAKLKKLKKA